MDKRFAAVISVVILGLFGLLLLSGGKQEGSNVTFEGDPTVITSEDKVKGNPEAKVELIEYGDFSCPACGAIHPIVEQAIQSYQDDIVFTFRHFPLERLHPNAVAAHRAAEAAANQGKFWEMYDLLYQRQQVWTRQGSGVSVEGAIETFKQFATELNLDMEQYQADTQSQETFNAIDLDIQSGNQLGVSGTPTFFLNGEKINNPRSYEELAAVIEQAIEDAEAVR